MTGSCPDAEPPTGRTGHSHIFEACTSDGYTTWWLAIARAHLEHAGLTARATLHHGPAAAVLTHPPLESVTLPIGSGEELTLKRPQDGRVGAAQ